MITRHLIIPSHEVVKHSVTAVYDFSVHGGAIGDITLATGALPDNAVITSVLIDVITPFTSGGSATIALKAGSAADLKAATAVASWTGFLNGEPVNTAATAVKLSADVAVKATVATAALTAGKAYIFIEYHQSI